MAELHYPRGSEWRKWDLHVHTPFSALSNGFGDNFDVYAKQLIEKAIATNVSAIGVTDYFTLEGYKQLRAIADTSHRLEELVGQDIASAARQLLLLPNIELRTAPIVTRSGQQDARVNFHVIFSNELDPAVIEEFFLRELRFTARAAPRGNPDEEWSLTTANLEHLGRRLKQEHAPFREHSDLYVGMMNASVSHEKVTSILQRQSSRFRNHYIIVVPADEDLANCSWDGQAHQTRKLFVQKADMLFSANPSTREFALGKKHPTVREFLNEFGSLKPCIHGSDAHSYAALFRPAEGRHLWIKADPSFLGLRQLLNEPETRVWIGTEPPTLARVRTNATKYMAELTFEPIDPPLADETWFSGSIPLNHGLVAIIGNKGSGKSALAAILFT